MQRTFIQGTNECKLGQIHRRNQILREICVPSLAKSNNVEETVFTEWKDTVCKEIKSKVEKLKSKRCRRYKSILKSPKVEQYLKDFQEKFVFVPTDKASNNIVVVCKKFYIQKSLEELNILENSEPGAMDDGLIEDSVSEEEIEKANTYMVVDENAKTIINRHKRYMHSNLYKDTEVPESFPFLYWIPKMHKKPISKQRYIAASYSCTTKPLSAVLTKCLRLVMKQHRIIGRRYLSDHGINPMWVLDNSSSVYKLVADFNIRKEARNVCTYDFSTLYTSIPHKKLKRQLSWVIGEAFRTSKKKLLVSTTRMRNGQNFPVRKLLH